MTTIQQALMETQLEKLEMLEVQRVYDEMKSHEESRGLARISQVLISIWQLPGIILKLAEGQSLVIDREGNMWKGRVKTDKFPSLPQKLHIKKSSHVLDVGTFQSMKTSSSVSSPGPVWKNQWDKIRTKLMKSESTGFYPMAVSFFLMEVDEIPQEELTYGENVAGNGDWKFTEITWSKYPDYTMGIVQATGTMKYWKLNGEVHWID